MNKPTEQAIRAAIWCRQFNPEHSDFVDNSAAAIDRETGLPQLLEALDHFEELIDAHYGTAFHHIGDGDGIPKETADKIRSFARSLLASKKGKE